MTAQSARRTPFDADATQLREVPESDQLPRGLALSMEVGNELGAAREERRIAAQIKWRKLQFIATQPGEESNVRSDARGFTHCQRERSSACLPGLGLHRSVCFHKPQKVTGDSRKPSVTSRL